MNVATLAKELGCTDLILRAISFHPKLQGQILWNVPVSYNWRLKNTAGIAKMIPLEIELHPGLTREPVEHVKTFLHELAHIMAYIVYGREGRGHGACWWEMMHQLGQKPIRTHNIAACKQRATLSLEDLDL